MDYKIYNIELVNRLLAWQHTAFNLFPVISSPILDRLRETISIPPSVRPGFIEPLNVISLKAADFVFYHNICRFFIVPFPRCRSPPAV